MNTKALLLHRPIFCPECRESFTYQHTTLSHYDRGSNCSRRGEMYVVDTSAVFFLRKEEGPKLPFVQIRPPRCPDCGSLFSASTFASCGLRVRFRHTIAVLPGVDHCNKEITLPIAHFTVFV